MFHALKVYDCAQIQRHSRRESVLDMSTSTTGCQMSGKPPLAAALVQNMEVKPSDVTARLRLFAVHVGKH